MQLKHLQHRAPARKDQRGFTMLELMIAGVLLIIILGVAVTQLLGRQNNQYKNQAIQLAGVDVPQALATYYQQHVRSYTGLDQNYFLQNGFADQAGNWTMACSSADQATVGTPSAQSIQIDYSFADCRNPDQFVAEVAGNLCTTLPGTNCKPMITNVSTTATDVLVTYKQPS